MPLTSKSEQLEAEFAAQCKQLRCAIEAAELETLPEIRVQLETVRELLAQGTEWWTKYDVRRNSEELVSLELSVDNASRRLRPRRRFRFSKVPPSERPAVQLEGKSALQKEALPLGRLGNGLVVDSRSIRNGKIELSDLNGKTLAIVDLNDVSIILHGSPTAVQLKNLTRCDVQSFLVNGTVFISECKDCIVNVGCHQLRIHQSKNCSLWTCSNCAPIIEGCEQMRFGELQIQGRQGHWDDVKDFTWLREDRSPNWDLLEAIKVFPARPTENQA